MNEISSLNALKQYAKRTGREIYTEEIPYPKSLLNVYNFQKHRRVAFIPYNTNKNIYFVWHNDPYGKLDMRKNFCGIFLILPNRMYGSFEIRPKFVIDKFNIFSQRNKSGDKYFDSKVIITGTTGNDAYTILTKRKIQDEILSCFRYREYLRVWVNKCNIDFMEQLNNKQTISIVNSNYWETDEKFVEKLFNYMNKISLAFEP